MPIKGLDNQARMKRIGIVRLGVRRVSEKTGREYPVATPYFVLKDAPGLVEDFGEQPTVLEILFYSEDLEVVFPHYYMMFSGRGLRCMGDGERVQWRRPEDEAWRANGVNIETGEVMACPCEYLEKGLGDEERAACQPTGWLRFMSAKRPTHGYYQVTMRKNAIREAMGQFALANDAIGRISGYPWLLKLERRLIRTPEGQRNLRIASIEIDPETWQRLLKERFAREIPALPAPVYKPPPAVDLEEAVDAEYEEYGEESPPEAEEHQRPADGAPEHKAQAAPRTGPIREEQLPRWWKRLDDLAAGKKMDPKEYEILKKQLHKDGLTWENFQAVSQIIRAWEPGPMTQEEQRGEQLQEALGAEAEMAKEQDRERWEGEGGDARDGFEQGPVDF